MTFLKKRSFAVCAAIGVGCALALTLLLTLPIAWAVLHEMLPETAGGICADIIAGLSVLVPTAVVAKSRGKGALAAGGAIGGGYLLLAALLCALSGGKSAFGPWLVCLAGAVMAGILAGALVSVRQNSHRKRRR